MNLEKIRLPIAPKLKDALETSKKFGYIFITERRAGTFLLLKGLFPAATGIKANINIHAESTLNCIDKTFQDVKVVLLTREDRVGQALSNIFMKNCDIPGHKNRRRPDKYEQKRENKSKVEYNFEKTLITIQKNWRKYLETLYTLNYHNINTLEITYEKMTEDPNGTLTEICRFIGVDKKCDVSLEDSVTLVSRGAIEQEHKERFYADLQEKGLSLC